MKLMALLFVLFLEAISFLFIAGAIALLAWAFGFVFTWKIAIGVWVVIKLLKVIFG